MAKTTKKPVKKEKTERVIENADVKIEIVGIGSEKIPVAPITQEFGNGDLNILRDKINEIIRTTN